MDKDNFSCIKEVTKAVRLTLPTAWESNEISGVSDTLESWKRQYIQQLQAVVVGYKNVSLISVLGYSKYECPFIRCDVNATFELFYPTVGSIVKGKINRLSHDHIGCLVHNTINVTIDQHSNASDISDFIALDRWILFEITRLNSKRKIVSVKGNITPECVKLMMESGEFKSKIDTIDNMSIYSPPKSDASIKCTRLKNSSLEKTYSSITDVQNSSDIACHISSPIKKKKHKRSKSVSSSPSLFSESLDSEVNEIEPTQLPEIMSKKKRKSKTETRTEENINNCDIGSSVYIKNEVHTDSSSSHTSPKNSSLKKNPETSIKSSPKRKHKKSKSGEFKSEIDAIDNMSIYSSPKSDAGIKSKKLKNSSLEKTYSSITDVQNSSDIACNIFSPIKKKKHKRSKSVSSSPSLFSESLDSEVNEIVPTQLPEIMSKKKRKSKTETSTEENINNCDIGSSLKNEVHTDSSSSHTSPKNSSLKKNPETSIKSSPKKKHKKSKSSDFNTFEEFLKLFNNDDSSLNVKEEIHFDSQNSMKSKKNSKDITVYEMMETLASFEPPPEAQLLSNEVLQSPIKEEPLNVTKISKKRKCDSPDTSNLPKKKRKIEDENISNEVHGKKKKSKKDSEKDKKKKSKKDSEKDKKKKSKDKVISTKKRIHGYKTKLKNGKK